MKKLFSSMNDSQYHFSLRKMSVGVCSVVLGLFFAGMNNAQVAKADTVVEPTINQQVQTKDSESSFTSIVNVNSDKAAPTQNKVAENNAGVKASAPNESEATESSKVTDKVKNNAEKIDKNLNNAQSFQESTKTTIFNVSNFAKNSDQDRTKGLLESKAIHSSAGWENHDGSLYYRTSDGNYLRNQWATPTGTIHYFGREGYTINNQWYTMPDNNTYYFDHTGHTVKNRWYTLPSKTTYYFDQFGHTVKNRWYNVSNNAYYFDNTGHTVKNRWYTLPTKRTYYFDGFGHTVTPLSNNSFVVIGYAPGQGITVKRSDENNVLHGTSRFLANGSLWKVIGKKSFNNQLFYYLNDDQWVPARFVIEGLANGNYRVLKNKANSRQYYTSQYNPVFAPWGCASSALSMLMKFDNTFNKVPGSTEYAKLKYMQDHLPRNKRLGGQDGNPYTGYGFTRVILSNALKNYAHQLGDKNVKDISGASLDTVAKLVLAGHPVLYYGWSSYDGGGNKARNHCKVIMGYNKKNNTFLVHDPLYSNRHFYKGGGGMREGIYNGYDLGPITWVSANSLSREYAYKGGYNALSI